MDAIDKTINYKEIIQRDWIEFMEIFFRVHKDEEEKEYEFETWTDAGVNMIICNISSLQEFIEYVNEFDVDEQIDLHRQMDDYRRVFSVRQSLHDFEKFQNWLDEIVIILNDSL